MADLFTQPSAKIDNQVLFFKLYNSKDEDDLLDIINTYSIIFDDSNWKPLGGNFSNYGVVKNQQSSPIAALIEKVTNAIDALLTKECILSGIDPKSDTAPNSMDEAIQKFYPENNWDLSSFRKEQAEKVLAADLS